MKLKFTENSYFPKLYIISEFYKNKLINITFLVKKFHFKCVGFHAFLLINFGNFFKIHIKNKENKLDLCYVISFHKLFP